MPRREDMTEDEWIDYGDRLYHETRDRMLAPRSEWGPNEWRLAQIEGRLQPQGHPTIAEQLDHDYRMGTTPDE